ncbi:MAG: sodium:solute symporter family protein [Bacteroidota bacterium]
MHEPVVHLHAVDSLLIILYLVAVVFIGFRAVRRVKSGVDEYLLAGRMLTLPMFVATLVSTWYGGILGVGEFSYRYGISNWVVFGLPYYFFALVFALFLARRVRETNLYTIPDKLLLAYGRKTAVLGAALLFILATPGAYVLMLGILIQLIFGWSLPVSVVVITFLTLVYLYAGGFRSDVWVNAFEFTLMFIGFAVMLFFAITTFGGLDFIQQNVPLLHLTWHGGNTTQYIAVWFFIALWTLVDPAFHQRCYAAKDARTAQRGILMSILFWLVFDFLTASTGLYARAVVPDLSQPMFSYPLLAERTLPVVAKGLFYIGMLATIMSTLSSLTLISAITVGKDIYGKLCTNPSVDDPTRREESINRYTKLGLLLTGTIAVVLALSIPSVVRLWYTIGTAIIPGLIVPVVASYFPRLAMKPNAAFWAMLLGWLTSTGWLVVGFINREGGTPVYPLAIEPMYPGLAMSIIIWQVGRARKSK